MSVEYNRELTDSCRNWNKSNQTTPCKKKKALGKMHLEAEGHLKGMKQ